MQAVHALPIIWNPKKKEPPDGISHEFFQPLLPKSAYEEEVAPTGFFRRSFANHAQCKRAHFACSEDDLAACDKAAAIESARQSRALRSTKKPNAIRNAPLSKARPAE